MCKLWISVLVMNDISCVQMEGNLKKKEKMVRKV